MSISSNRLLRQLARLWRWLTEPAASIHEPDQRRQAQLLAGLLVSVVPLGLLVAAIPILIEHPGRSILGDADFQVAVVAALLSTIAYVLSRTRYYKLASVFVLLMGSVAIFVASVPQTQPIRMNQLIYLILPVLLASTLLSLRAATLVVVLNLAGILLFSVLVPQVAPLDLFSDPFSFFLLASIMTLLIAHHRNLLEADRRKLLAASEERLRQLTDNMLDLIVTVDLQGNIQYASPSVQTVLGYSPEQVVGKPVFARIHPDEVGRLKHLLQIGLKTGLSGRAEHRAQHADGHYLWLEAVGKALVNADGIVEGAIFVSRDITERKQAEIVFRETEQRFRAVISNAPVILFAFDTDSNLTLIEGKGLERLGASFDLVFGTPVARVYPDEPTVMEMIERALAGEEFSAVVHLATLVFEIICTPLRDADHQIVGMIGVGVDVTERVHAEEASRASERQYATLLEQASDAIFVADEHGNYIDVNAAACEMLGYTREELLRLNIQEVVAAEDLKTAPIPWEQMRIRMVLMERQLVRKDGSLVNVEVSAKVLDDGRMQAIARDITERKQAEKQQFELAIEKERTTLLQRFLGDASHDLRTPLTIMKTSIYLLRRLADHERRIRHLDMLDEQTAHLQRLLEDFLSITRLNQAQAEEFRFARLDLNAVIRTVMESQIPLADQKNHVLEFIPETNVPPVTADEVHLHRAIAHLVLNALNYTPDGGRITIRSYHDADWSVVEVKDNGIGIPEADLSHIFEPFFRVDKARAAETGGTGLGLVMVKKIIDAHGGKITVDSTPGAGSTFRVWLPVAVQSERSLAQE